MKVQGNESHSRSLRRMGVFVLVMLPIVIGLGIWQLERAAYKQGLMDAYFDKLGGLPKPLLGEVLPEAFTLVRLNGRYQTTNLLLDNQVNDGRQGYWVYTPFTSAQATWLINRGWYEAPGARGETPQIPPVPAQEVDIVALVWPDTGMLPLFGTEAADAMEQFNEQTWRMQRLDFDALRERIPQTLLPTLSQAVELRLEAAQPGVLKALPQTIGFGVERHKGYAFQWFGLALALVVGFYFYRRSFAQSNLAREQTNIFQENP